MADPLNVYQQKPFRTSVLHVPSPVIHHQYQPVPIHHSLGGVQHEQHADQAAPILRSSSNSGPDGTYEYSYETGNGILVQESGVGGHNAHGLAKWVSPEGTPLELTYTADENGFQAYGSHLPTSPPIPDAILRSLAYIESHPGPKEEVARYNSPHAHSHPAPVPITPQQQLLRHQQVKPVHKPFVLQTQYKKY